MYETRKQRPLAPHAFARRMGAHVAVVVALLIASLAVGMVGYVALEHLSWLDAFVDSAMLLGGMGPVHPPQTGGGKLFAGLYALYAGLVFIVSAALIFTPVLHRLMHHFHFDDRS
jgi:hypothetical protein